MLTNPVTGPRWRRLPPHGGLRAEGAVIARLSVALIKCGTCGKRYSNPITHVCITRLDRKTPPKRSKVKPKIGVTCGSCGQPLGNPLTHRCVTRTDFKRRKAAAGKPPPKPASTGNAHEYTACKDRDCSRFPCRVYKEGRGDGYDVGFQRGVAEGYAEGYDRGFIDGIDACPRPHDGS
jgi:hypothetical protein